MSLKLTIYPNNCTLSCNSDKRTCSVCLNSGGGFKITSLFKSLGPCLNQGQETNIRNNAFESLVHFLSVEGPFLTLLENVHRWVIYTVGQLKKMNPKHGSA